MKRSTWLAVALTAGVLILAGNLPRLPWDALAGSWQRSLTRQVAAWPHRARRLAPPPAVAPAAAPVVRAATPPRVPRPAPPRGPAHVPAEVLVGGALGVLAGLATLALIARVGPRDLRGRVYRLARGGHSAGGIARRARVPQDAVRTLLSPGVGMRR